MRILDSLQQQVTYYIFDTVYVLNVNPRDHSTRDYKILIFHLIKTHLSSSHLIITSHHHHHYHYHHSSHQDTSHLSSYQDTHLSSHHIIISSHLIFSHLITSSHLISHLIKSYLISSHQGSSFISSRLISSLTSSRHSSLSFTITLISIVHKQEPRATRLVKDIRLP